MVTGTGLLPVLKQPGLTSHDVVVRIRRLLGVRRIGHTGTLDPGAAGVLVLLVGRATRLAQLLQDEDKEYIAEMFIGKSTDTQDAFGKVLSSAPNCRLARDELLDVLSGFVGTVQQVPPMTAAVRQGGRRLYEWAREGIEIERPARQVFIDKLDLCRIEPDHPLLRFGARVTFRVQCSKGTYVRTLCHDIGEALGTGAFMSFLLRTRVGDISLSMTRTLDELEREAKTGPIRLLPVDTALTHIPAVHLSAVGARHVLHGRPVEDEHVVRRSSSRSPFTGQRGRPGEDLWRLYDEKGRLLALAETDGHKTGRLRPRIVFWDERGE